MAPRQSVKRRLDDMKREIRQAVPNARRKSPAAGEGASTLNVARRANIVAAANVGEDGASREASASQQVRVSQRDGRTQVVSESDHNTS